MYYRNATINDTESVVKFINRAYRGESSYQGWTTEAAILDGQRTDANEIHELIKKQDSKLILFFSDQHELQGSVHVQKESITTLYFGMLVVKPELQGTGLGKIILNHIDSVAKNLKVEKVRISVINVRTELIAYYERRGFKRTDRVEPFPYGDPRFGIPKVSGLYFLTFEKTIS